MRFNIIKTMELTKWQKENLIKQLLFSRLHSRILLLEKRECFVFISFLQHFYHHLIYNADDNGDNHQGQWSPRWSWASSSPPQSKAWGRATASRMRRTCRGRWWRRRWRWSTSRESRRSACGDLLHTRVGGQGSLPPKCFHHTYKSLTIGMVISIASKIVIIIKLKTTARIVMFNCSRQKRPLAYRPTPQSTSLIIGSLHWLYP